jgi:hypothetical protein
MRLFIPYLQLWPHEQLSVLFITLCMFEYNAPFQSPMLSCSKSAHTALASGYERELPALISRRLQDGSSSTATHRSCCSHGCNDGPADRAEQHDQVLLQKLIGNSTSSSKKPEECPEGKAEFKQWSLTFQAFPHIQIH